jgi:hypothetical protein
MPTLQIRPHFEIALVIAGIGLTVACNSGTAVGSAEGCRDDADCAADERCDFPDGQCGDGAPGTCTENGFGCSTGAGPYPLVCGCDGAFHSSDCVATDGVDGSEDVSICGAPPPGTFPCASSLCNSGFDYCLVTGNTSSCNGGALGCVTCECLGDAICDGGSCADEDGALIVTCPAVGG